MVFRRQMKDDTLFKSVTWLSIFCEECLVSRFVIVRISSFSSVSEFTLDRVLRVNFFLPSCRHLYSFHNQKIRRTAICLHKQQLFSTYLQLKVNVPKSVRTVPAKISGIDFIQPFHFIVTSHPLFGLHYSLEVKK